MSARNNIVILVLALLILFIVNYLFLFHMNFPLFNDNFSYTTNISNLIIVIVYFLLICITIYSILHLFIKLLNLNRELIDSIKFLQKYQDKDINDIFQNIKKHFSEKDELKNAWNQFAKTIRRIKIKAVGEQPNKYLATLDAEYFFNEDLIKNKIIFKLHNYLPQSLIAIGIFGTFLGLVLGLQGLNLATSETTQNSMRILINGVKLSFLTSLYGVSNSIILTFFQKAYLGSLESKAYKLASEIDLLFPKNTQEDGVKELHFELEKQTSSLESLATNLAEVLDEKISSSLKENFGPVLDKLGDSAARLAEMSENTNRDTIMNLIEHTGEIVSSSTQREINKLTNSLEGITQKNEELFNNLGDSVSQIEQLINNQKQVINQTNASAANMEETNQSVIGIGDELKNIISTLSSFSDKQQTSFSDFSIMLENMNNYLERQAEMNQMISATLEDNLKNSREQKDIYQMLNNTSKNLLDFNNKFDSILGTIENNLNQFKTLSDNINNKYIKTINRVDNHYENIDESLDNTIDSFNTVVEKFREEIINNLDHINNDYKDITEKLATFSTNSNKITARLEQFSNVEEETQKIWNSYQESFDNLNQEINNGVIDYTNAVRNRSNELLSDYDNQLGSTIQNFYDLFERFNDSIDDMNDTLDKLSEINRGLD